MNVLLWVLGVCSIARRVEPLWVTCNDTGVEGEVGELPRVDAAAVQTRGAASR